MDPFGVKITPLAVSAAVLLAVRALKKKNLTPSGAITGCIVGFLILGSGLRGMLLFIFYQCGSVATKIKQSLKEQRDATMSDHSARGALQVLAVSFTPVLLSLVHVFYCGEEKPVNFAATSNENSVFASYLTCAIVSHHATCLADTLASEMGIVSDQNPILITRPWQEVPHGTNGGITKVGLFWSLAGGGIIGASVVLMDWLSGLSPLNIVRMIIFGCISGLVGSLSDSVIGATLQSSYYDHERKLIYHANSDNLPKSAQLISGLNMLTNEQVNFLSALMTALFGGWVLGPIVFI